jgi:large subunit ribosomal protein L31
MPPPLFRQVIDNRVKKRHDRRSDDWLPTFIEETMKENIHPNYREVVFHDLSCDFKFITRSTIATRDTIDFNGKQYPLVKIEVSSESHPFFTGQHKIVDTAGRVEKFRQKFGKVGSRTAVAGG